MPLRPSPGRHPASMMQDKGSVAYVPQSFHRKLCSTNSDYSYHILALFTRKDLLADGASGHQGLDGWACGK